ncbi:DUF6169 family protein [Spirosoma sp. RP8]|uniref:DUF6169 family protein n=1 Tax=Spirosoma liriopis TaxID=2937440 RepID=A0ABT0HV28_9BACT|nr:DUF6169 family protein [Spirosoma liriopis]MCK8496036.1 DUF6169 family protein [Spirosoma liriopis]
MSNYLPYPLISDEDGFLFTTDAGIEYRILTRPDADYFPDLEFAESIFSFSFYPANNAEPSKESDPRIECTVIYALVLIFDSRPDVVLSFTCSTKDGRERHRSILFGKWFSQYGGGYTRIKRSNPQTSFYAYTIFLADHPHSEQIKEEFERVYINK